MHQVCRIDIQEGTNVSGSIMAELSELAQQIRSRIDVDRIILYGSFAREDFNEGSDIDLVVVGDFRERFHKRPLDIIGITDLPIEPVCYTKDEFDDLVRRKNPFIISVIEEGISI